MNWPMIPVSELCEFAVDCVNKTAPTVDHETEFKMIRTTNVKGGFIDLKDVRFVTEEVFSKWTRRSRPQYGDVVLTREAPVGEVGRFTSNDEKVFLGQRLFHYRPDPNKLDWNFLAYVLQSPQIQGKFKGMGFGATVDHVRVGDAERLPIPCPPLKVQKKIGDILSTYDDLIENNRRRIQLLEQAARLLYKEWFVHLRFPGHEHTRIINGVPEGWSMQPIKNVVEGVYDGPHATPPAVDNGPIFLGIKNITESGRLDLTSKRCISESDFPKWTRRIKPQPGDIVFSYEATLNLYALIPEGFRGCLGRRLALVRPIAKDRTGLFIYYTFFAHRWRTVIEQNRLCGATVDRVPIAKFPDFPLLMPPRRLIVTFDDHVLSLRKQMETLERENELLAKARDILLPKLMNGEAV